MFIFPNLSSFGTVSYNRRSFYKASIFLHSGAPAIINSSHIFSLLSLLNWDKVYFSQLSTIVFNKVLLGLFGYLHFCVLLSYWWQKTNWY